MCIADLLSHGKPQCTFKYSNCLGHYLRYIKFLLMSLLSFFFHEEQRLEVSGNNISSTSIRVYWNSVSLEIISYNVRYWAETEGEGSALENEVSKKRNSLKIHKLEMFTVYVVQVTALINITGQLIRGQAKISTDEGGMPCWIKCQI